MKLRKRKNCRKSQTVNVMTGRSLHIAGIIAALVAMTVINLVADARCKQTQKAIGEKQRELVRLEQDRRRESAAWDQMTTAENLSRALVRHGLNMRIAKPEQVVRMNSDGRPRYGQPSVELAKARNAAGSVASNVRVRTRR